MGVYFYGNLSRQLSACDSPSRSKCKLQICVLKNDVFFTVKETTPERLAIATIFICNVMNLILNYNSFTQAMNNREGENETIEKQRENEVS